MPRDFETSRRQTKICSATLLRSLETWGLSHDALYYKAASRRCRAQSRIKMIQVIEITTLLLYLSIVFNTLVSATPADAFRGKIANRDQSEAIVQAYQHAWAGYFKCAYKSDTVDALRCAALNDRGGWGISVIDSIGTSLIMNLTDIANLQIDYALGVDFRAIGKAKMIDKTISAFETTIRILGGLLSTTDLLENGYGSVVPDYKPKAFLLLMQAKAIADTLEPIWNTPSGLPAKRLDLTTKPAKIQPLGDGPVNSAAGIGTSQLEYARLSHMTGQKIYVDRSIAAVEKLFSPRAKEGLKKTLPGLVGSTFDVDTGLMTSDSGSWGGGSDSCKEDSRVFRSHLTCSDYEYLLKMSIYDPVSYARFRDQYVLAARTTRDHLRSNPAGFKNVTFLTAFEGSAPEYTTGHLACFAGGSFLLSRITEFKQMGEDLTAGCHHVYQSTGTGLAPELWHWQDSLSSPSKDVQPEDAVYAKAHGFWPDADSQYYSLRPEVLESYFIAWRVTHDKKYRDWAWDAFLAINASCYIEHGYIGISNVTIKSPQRDEARLVDLGLNKMESFFLSETLKYAYLIFQDDDVISLDDWVLNTEGHPLRILAKDKVDHSKARECLSPKGCDDWPQIPWNEMWLQSDSAQRLEVLSMLTTKLA